MSDLMPWMAPWSGRMLAAVLTAIGLWLIWRGLFQDRAKDHPRCPKCWYDLRMLPSSTCPECGHTTHSEHDRFRTRRHWRLVIVGLIVMMGLPTFVVQRRVREYGWGYYTIYGPYYWLWPDDVLEAATREHWTVQVVQDRRGRGGIGSTLVVRYRKQVLLSEPGSWTLGLRFTDYRWEPQPFVDLTGDDHSELVAHSYYSGTRSHLYVFSLSPEGVIPIAKVYAGQGLIDLLDLDGDGSMEIIAPGGASWETPPPPPAVYKLKHDGYKLAPDLRYFDIK